MTISPGAGAEEEEEEEEGWYGCDCDDPCVKD